MKCLLSIMGGLLGLLALGALAVALALTFGGLRRDVKPVSQAFQSPIETPTQPPYPPPATPTLPGPPATPTVAPTPVPRCTFAARPVPAEPAPPLEAYQFSEPRVVLTHTSAIGIAGWLPDGQRLLITRRIPGQPREYVETFNVQTGELQRYGERHSFDAKPVWLRAEQAAAFADVSPDKGKVLRISRGEGIPVEEAATELAAPYLAASPDGQRVVFFTKAAQTRPEALDVAQAQRQLLSFTLPWPSWRDLPVLGQQVGPEPYRAAWHPDGNRVAFYNDTGFYLADLVTGQICEVDLGPHLDGKRWTFHVQWSPNGRYLAALTTVGDPAVGFSDLTLIDTNTGERRHLDLGLQYLYAATWAPNSRDLLVVAQKGTTESGLGLHGLYVVTAATGDAREILAGHQFIVTGAWGVEWSPNGQTIALACPLVAPEKPLITEGRLCIISVEVRQ